MKEENKKSNKKLILPILIIALFMFSVVGLSFAAFTFIGTGTQENTISTGTITMTYSEEGDGISITNALPMSDAAGIAQSDDNAVFEFTVSATITGSTTIGYEIAAIKKSVGANQLADTDVKLYLAETTSGSETELMAPTNFIPSTTATAIGSPIGSMVMYSGSVTADMTRNYVMKMWVDEDYISGADSKAYTVTVNVYGKAS